MLIDPSSLNSGDVFVLVLPGRSKLFTWYGNHASEEQENSAETMRECMFGNYDHDEVYEQDESDEFKHYLSIDEDVGRLRDQDYAHMTAEGNDGKVFYEEAPRFFVTRCTQLTKFEVSPHTKMTKDMLATNVCVIVDCTTRTFIWHGRHTSDRHRRLTRALQKKFYDLVEQEERGNHTVAIEKEGGESLLFQSLFIDWDLDQYRRDWMHDQDERLSLGRVMTDEEARDYRRQLKEYEKHQLIQINEIQKKQGDPSRKPKKNAKMYAKVSLV